MTPPEIRSWLIDMDGVLVHEETAIPGAAAFLERLTELGMRFMVMTNNSIYTPRDLAARLRASGLDVPVRASGPPPWRPPGFFGSSDRAARRSSSARRA